MYTPVHSHLKTLPYYWWWLGAGLCLGLGTGNLDYWWLVFPGIFLFFYGFKLSTTVTQVFWGALLAGFLHKSGAIWWSLDMFPFSWLEADDTTMLVGIIFVWLSSALMLSSGIALATTFLWWKRGVFAPFIIIFIAPTVWVLGESLGALIFSLYSFGPGGIINPYFAHGFVGYSVSHITLLYPLVLFGGVYALSWICVFLVSLLVFLPENIKIRIYGVIVTLTILLSLYSIFPPSPLTQSGQTVLTINTYFPSSVITTPLGAINKVRETSFAIGTALSFNSDLIIMPEYSELTTYIGGQAETLNLLSSVASTTPVVIDISETQLENGLSVTRGYLYNLKNNTIDVQDKQYLVPQGEYLPYLARGILKLFGNSELIAVYDAKYNHVAGPEKSQSATDGAPAMLFCHESSLAKPLKGVEPGSVVAHPISHGWFSDRELVQKQLSAMLRVAAVWNQVTIVQAGNLAPGAAYRPNGTINYGDTLVHTTTWNITSFTY